MLRSLSLALTFTTLALAHAPSYLSGRGTWYHARDHPVHKLFPRLSTDGAEYPEVGSAAWSASYPASALDSEQLPQTWKDALDAVVADGRIPNLPPSTIDEEGFTVYPDHLDPAGPEVCSSTFKCMTGEGVVWDAPDGFIGIGFDDGPELGTGKLVNYLAEQQQTATHFLIGSKILGNPEGFLAILAQGGDMAVHTWTHPYMTSLSNEEVVAELGWTMEIIRQSSGGRIPKYWRPPYGDSDNRVNAIAKEVLGMEPIIWNQDTDDWAMSTGKQTMEGIASSMNTWLTGPKSPGLVILHHESTEDTVQAFMNSFPLMSANGWQTKSMALLVSDSAYQNSDGTSEGSTVTPASIVQLSQFVSKPQPVQEVGEVEDITSPSAVLHAVADVTSTFTPHTRPSQPPTSTSSTSASDSASSENSATTTKLGHIFAFAVVLATLIAY